MLTRIILLLFGLSILGGAAAGGIWYVRGRGDPMQRAEVLLKAGDLRAAFVELRAASRDRPKDPAPHLALADLQLRLSDPESSERELRVAQSLGADRWAVLIALAPALAAQGMNKELLDQLPPNGPTPNITLKLLLARSAAQLALGDEAAARASLAAANQAMPDTADASIMAARLALAHDDLQQAERDVDTALQRNPSVLDALLMKERLALVRGDSAAALTALDRAVAVAPWSHVARLDRVTLLLTSRQDAKARADVDALLAAQPRDAAARLASGVLMLRAGRFADAAVELQKLGGSTKSLPRALYFQAMAAANLGQTASAQEMADRYVTAVPDDPDGLRLVAQIHLAAQQPQRAIESLQRITGAEAADPRTLDLLGTAQSMLGQFQQASQSFSAAARAAPDDVQILRHLGLTENRIGGGGLASTLDRLADLAPRESDAAEALVSTALTAGELDKAGAALERLRAQVGSTEAVGMLTGALRLAQLDQPGAEAAFADVVKRFPDSVNARLNLAEILGLRGRAGEGEALLLPTLTAQPANMRVLTTYVQSALRHQGYAAAIQALEAARKAAPATMAFTAMLSDVFVQLGDPRRAIILVQGNRRASDLPPVLLAALWRAQIAADQPDAAKATFEAAIQASPADMDVRRAQADFLLQRNDVPAARAVMEDALRQAPGNYAVLSSLVALAGRSQGMEGALNAAAALRLNPANQPQAAMLKGDALMRAKRYPEAAAAFQAEFAATPRTPLVLRLADALASAGQDDAGAAALRRWLAQPGAPAAGTVERGAVELLLSKLDINAKRYPEAQDRLERLVVAFPNDAIALNNLAWLYAQRGDPKARAMAQRAYLRAPSSDSADTLGWIMVQQGEAPKALLLLRQAVRQRPEDASAAYHLAVALRDDGQTAESAALLEKMVAEDAEFPEAPLARTLLQALKAGR